MAPLADGLPGCLRGSRVRRPGESCFPPLPRVLLLRFRGLSPACRGLSSACRLTAPACLAHLPCPAGRRSSAWPSPARGPFSRQNLYCWGGGGGKGRSKGTKGSRRCSRSQRRYSSPAGGSDNPLKRGRRSDRSGAGGRSLRAPNRSAAWRSFRQFAASMAHALKLRFKNVPKNSRTPRRPERASISTFSRLSESRFPAMIAAGVPPPPPAAPPLPAPCPLPLPALPGRRGTTGESPTPITGVCATPSCPARRPRPAPARAAAQRRRSAQLRPPSSITQSLTLLSRLPTPDSRPPRSNQPRQPTPIHGPRSNDGAVVLMIAMTRWNQAVKRLVQAVQACLLARSVCPWPPRARARSVHGRAAPGLSMAAPAAPGQVFPWSSLDFFDASARNGKFEFPRSEGGASGRWGRGRGR